MSNFLLGLVEQHKIPRSEENPVGCKPLKEITHISSLVEFLSQYQKPIQEKALNITFDTIINSCNILTCSKIKQDISQKEPLTINDASFADLYNEMMRCECLAMLGPNKSLYPQLNGSEQKQQDIFHFEEKNKTKIENCLCEETMFMKHIHNASCGHPKVFHDDHYDYIVDGRLHHVHGNHCDDHGKVLIVE